MKTGKAEKIVSTTQVTVRPEHRTELCLTISSLLDLIRCEEGCRAYKFYMEDGDQDSFLLFSEWETRDAWVNHLNSDHFAVLHGSLDLLSSRSNVDFKLLSPVAGIEGLTRKDAKAQSPMSIK